MNAELKPCPFCGGTYIVNFSVTKPPTYKYGCAQCGIATLSSLDEAEAIAAWNTRTAELRRECVWTWNEECGRWETNCRNYNNHKHISLWDFCPFCGKRIKEVK